MNSTALTKEIQDLAGEIAELDDRVGELREQLRAFQGETDLALPADWEPDTASAELTQSLKQRHSANNRYRELVGKLGDARKEEFKRSMAKCRKEHQAACLKIIRLGAEMARACEEEKTARMDAGLLVGGFTSPIEAFGPVGMFESKDISSGLSYWIREGIQRGFIKRDDPTLAGITF